MYSTASPLAFAVFGRESDFEAAWAAAEGVRWTASFAEGKSRVVFTPVSGFPLNVWAPCAAFGVSSFFALPGVAAGVAIASSAGDRVDGVAARTPRRPAGVIPSPSSSFWESPNKPSFPASLAERSWFWWWSHLRSGLGQLSKVATRTVRRTIVTTGLIGICRWWNIMLCRHSACFSPPSTLFFHAGASPTNRLFSLVYHSLPLTDGTRSRNHAKNGLFAIVEKPDGWTSTELRSCFQDLSGIDYWRNWALRAGHSLARAGFIIGPRHMWAAAVIDQLITQRPAWPGPDQWLAALASSWSWSLAAKSWPRGRLLVDLHAPVDGHIIWHDFIL